MDGALTLDRLVADAGARLGRLARQLVLHLAPLLALACGADPRAARATTAPAPTVEPAQFVPGRGAAEPAVVAPPDGPTAPVLVGPPEAPLPPLPGYLKGQLHLHTDFSGDSQTAANVAVEYYRERGYDFIVVTDHNHVTELPPRAGDMLVFPGVELTHNTLDCDPPPEKKKCLIHVNALFVDTPAPVELPVPERTSNLRVDLYQRFLTASDRLGGLAMLNHPNFQWTVSPALAAEIGRRGVRLVEVANQGMPLSNPGDATHVATEQLWDQVLAAGVRMWAVASDDAHHYHDVEAARAYEEKTEGESNEVYPADRGWVMVRASAERASIRAALARGDFYASTGVTLAELAVEDDALVVAAAGPGPFRIECIGEGMRLVADAVATRARCPRAGAGAFVRARITDGAGRHAWTQPVFAADP